MSTNIHSAIKKLREKHRFSQYEMADRLNISQSTYLQIERGKTELTVSRLIAIAEIFGVEPASLLESNEGRKAESKSAKVAARPEEQGDIKDFEEFKRRVKKLTADVEEFEQQIAARKKRRSDLLSGKR